MEYPKFDNRTTGDLSDKQIEAFLDSANMYGNQQVGAIFRLALYTGMRAEEMLRLQWSDIDFKREFITMRNPKGVVAETIPINRHAGDTLEEIPRS